MFDHIVPCGIRDRGVTSMARAARSRAPPMRAVVDRVVARFAEAFGSRRGRPPGRRVAHGRRRSRAVHRGGAARRRRRCGCSAGSPPPGVEADADPACRRPEWMKVRARLRRRVPRAEAARARPRPAHGVRGGRLPEHLRVLGRPHRDVHDPRRPLHARVRLLPRRHAQAARRSTPTSRAASPTRSRTLGLAHVVITCVARDDLARRRRVGVRGDGRRGARREPGHDGRAADLRLQGRRRRRSTTIFDAAPRRAEPQPRDGRPAAARGAPVGRVRPLALGARRGPRTPGSSRSRASSSAWARRVDEVRGRARRPARRSASTSSRSASTCGRRRSTCRSRGGGRPTSSTTLGDVRRGARASRTSKSGPLVRSSYHARAGIDRHGRRRVA